MNRKKAMKVFNLWLEISEAEIKDVEGNLRYNSESDKKRLKQLKKRLEKM